KDRLQWIIPSFPAGGSRMFTVSATAALPGKIELISQVLAKGSQATSNVATEFIGAVALRLRVEESADPVQVNEKVTYTVIIENTGNAEAKGINLRINYPLTLLNPKTVTPQSGKTAANGDLEFSGLTVKPRDFLRVIVTMQAAADGT